MPVGKPATRREVTAVVLALGGVLLAVALGAGVLLFARSGDVEVRLGPSMWEVGEAEAVARAIGEDGPFVVSDVSGGDRDIILSHVGDDPDSGWHAFAARPPGAPRECSVAWDREASALREPCSGAVYPLDGEGLEQYPVLVDGGEVVVDINRRGRDGPGGPSPTSSVVRSGTPRASDG